MFVRANHRVNHRVNHKVRVKYSVNHRVTRTRCKSILNEYALTAARHKSNVFCDYCKGTK